ncbi:MAG: PEGA domain-containing protein [Spirochaetota bacterium]
MRRLLVCTATLALLCAGNLQAGGTSEAEPDIEAPEDPREEYVVGFQVFDSQGISQANPELAHTIPRLLREEMSQLPERRLSDTEREAQAQALLEEAVVEAGAKVDERVDRLGELRFDTGREDKRTERVEAAREDLEAARAELAAFEALDTSAVDIERTKPLSFPGESADDSAGGPAEGAVTEGTQPFAVDRYPRRLSREEDLDLLITGHIEEVEDTLVVRTEVYSRFLERVVHEQRTAGAPGDTEALLESLREELAEELLGRPWGRLSITSSLDDAAIYVDDRLVGFGEVTLSYTRTGTRDVRASQEGFDDEQQEVEVSRFETTSVELEFPEPESGEVRLESRPEGADVYVGSIWQGVTPLTLQRPADLETAILSREGYLDEKVVLSNQAPHEITRELVPDQGDWPAIVEDRRDSFYSAFGWFALSLPFPVMLNGMYQDIAALYPGGTPSSELSRSEAERLATTANAMLWSARGTTAVSAGLFVNMMVQLVKYIRAGQYAH